MGQTKHVVDQVWAAMEPGNLEALDQLIEPEIEFRMGSVDGTGIGFFGPFLQSYLAGSPDLRHEVIDWVRSGDTIGRIRSWHVHSDNPAFMTQLGLIPALAQTGA